MGPLELERSSPPVRGLLLTGGSGSRLYPLTVAVNKHLLPVYNKPLVYYPLTTLMLAGVREVAVVSSPRDLPAMRLLLGSGKQWGLTLTYLEQPEPAGVADALRRAGAWLDGAACVLALGDNLFYGNGLLERLQGALRQNPGATLFGFPVRHPERYGVVTCDRAGIPIKLEEKPERHSLPQPGQLRRLAVTGLYVYDGRAPVWADSLSPSARGELEITDLNRRYLSEGALRLERLGRGFTWLDAGLPGALLQAGGLVQTIERRTGLLVGCPEEVAWRQGWIDDAHLRSLAQQLRSAHYGRYLLGLLREQEQA